MAVVGDAVRQPGWRGLLSEVASVGQRIIWSSTRDRDARPMTTDGAGRLRGRSGRVVEPGCYAGAQVVSINAAMMMEAAVGAAKD